MKKGSSRGGDSENVYKVKAWGSKTRKIHTQVMKYASVAATVTLSYELRSQMKSITV